MITTELPRIVRERASDTVYQIIRDRITVRADRVVREHRDTNRHCDTDNDDAEDDKKKLLLSHTLPRCVCL